MTDGLRNAALRWAGLAAEKQFSGRKGHGGNPQLAERHLSRQELQVLLAAAFEAGAELTSPQDDLRMALTNLCDAFNNRGETTSIKEWNDRMKVAHDNAREALAGRLPFSEPA